MATVYNVGDGVRYQITVTDPTNNDAPVDPVDVTLYVTKPDGTTVEPTVTAAATGVYRADVYFDTAGHWSRQWVTSAEKPGATPITTMRVLPSLG
jgi:uncharacterized protein YfaS (alpha-2-macroglobulin family)